MNNVREFIHFLIEQKGKLLEQTLAHIGLTFISLFIAVVIGLPLGIWISRRKSLASPVLSFTGILQTIPSIALLGFMIPLLGIGPKPAIFALFLYALLPIVRNTYTGITGIDPSIKEAAIGMGMTDFQLLLKVELPLAMPVIFAGIRTATVINVGVATLAAYIAAGGLGEFIFGGIALNNTYMILAGAIPAALLAILFDFLLSRVQYLQGKRSRKSFHILFIFIPLLSSFYLITSADASSLKAGFSPEFIGRKDGYPGIQQNYALKINNVVIAPALVYKAVYENDVQVIDGYSTDGRIEAYDLIILEDDLNSFPPYYAAPVVRTAVLEKYPELEEVLNMLANQISDSAMTAMNYQVDYKKKTPREVAVAFLKKKNLYAPAREGKKGTIRVGSKIFSEQYILAEMYKIIVEAYTDLSVATTTGLGGTKICFDALREGEIDLYPEYTGTGLQVILQPSSEELAQLDNNRQEVYRYVDEQFNKKYAIDWLKPLGFNNTYALLMTRAKAKNLAITSISDLKHYLENN